METDGQQRHAAATGALLRQLLGSRPAYVRAPLVREEQFVAAQAIHTTPRPATDAPRCCGPRLSCYGVGVGVGVASYERHRNRVVNCSRT